MIDVWASRKVELDGLNAAALCGRPARSDRLESVETAEAHSGLSVWKRGGFGVDEATDSADPKPFHRCRFCDDVGTDWMAVLDPRFGAERIGVRVEDVLPDVIADLAREAEERGFDAVSLGTSGLLVVAHNAGDELQLTCSRSRRGLQRRWT